ncbi:MAG: RibD family protein, partial [Rubrobacteraceae bacterium]
MKPRRIHPPPAVEVDDIHGELEFPKFGPKDSGLPYVVMNMVSSLDGKVSVSGKSGAIGSAVDRNAMRVLRSKVDAVMVGAGTLRAEKVSLTSEGRRTPEPMAVIPSASLDLPLETNLLDAQKDRTLILAPDHAYEKASDVCLGHATLVSCKARPDGTLDIEDALRTLKRDFGIANLLVEGGSRLNHEFVERDITQEIFLTLSPKLLGGFSKEAPVAIEGNTFEKSKRMLLTSI